MAPVAIGALLVMFFMAGHPERLHEWLLKAEAMLPARIAAVIAQLRADVCRGLCGGAAARAAGRGAGVVDRVVDRDRRRHLGGVDGLRHRDAVHRRAG